MNPNISYISHSDFKKPFKQKIADGKLFGSVTRFNYYPK
jgi:hypothetical protein